MHLSNEDFSRLTANSEAQFYYAVARIFWCSLVLFPTYGMFINGSNSSLCPRRAFRSKWIPHFVNKPRSRNGARAVTRTSYIRRFVSELFSAKTLLNFTRGGVHSFYIMPASRWPTSSSFLYCERENVHSIIFQTSRRPPKRLNAMRTRGWCVLNNGENREPEVFAGRFAVISRHR